MSLSTMLGRLFRDSLTSRVTVSRPGTAGNNPTRAAVETQVPAMIVPANVRDAEVVGVGYAHTPTHQALLEANENVRTGYWFTETHWLGERGAWTSITAAEQRTFLVLGVEQVAGVPEPRNQWRAWLWQETSRPVGGD